MPELPEVEVVKQSLEKYILNKHLIKIVVKKNNTANTESWNGSSWTEVNNLNPNSVIYLIGSLWGGSQIVVLFISIIILIKYKSLLSLAWLVFVFDNILRIITMTMHNLDQDYLTSTAPGGLVGTSVMLFVTLLMFFISTIERKQK